MAKGRGKGLAATILLLALLGLSGVLAVAQAAQPVQASQAAPPAQALPSGQASQASQVNQAAQAEAPSAPALAAPAAAQAAQPSQTAPSAQAEQAEQAAPSASSAQKNAQESTGAGTLFFGKGERAVAPAPEQSILGNYFVGIGALALILGGLFGLLWLMRRSGKFRFMPAHGSFPREALRVEAQLPLGPRKGLMVVRFLNKRVLLGLTDQQITLLAEAEDDEQAGADFGTSLENAVRQESDPREN